MPTVVQRRLMVINQGGGGGVTAVTALAPLVSGPPAATPEISITPGTNPGDLLVWNGAAWVISPPVGAVAPAFEWNLNGSLIGPGTQPPAGFHGMSTSSPPADVAALTGPGPFDGTRRVTRSGTIVLCGFYLRNPGASGQVTWIEFYRIRAGTVTSLTPFPVRVGLSGGATAFSGVTTVPAVTDLVVDDLLFVALAADGGPALTAEDLSAFIQVTP
jgi:hypothetical protein